MRIVIRTTLTSLALLAGCTGAERTSQHDDPLVGPEGLTLAVIRGPIEFRMGSPEGEVGRNPASDSPEETQHTARIPRSYAISHHEVTVAQFQRFLDAHPT